MRLSPLAVAIVLALIWAPARAQEDLVTDISEHLVSIESNFTGAELLIFGSVAAKREGEGRRDIIIVVRGPEVPVVVRRKARVAGIWLNYDAATLAGVPGYYAVLSSRTPAAIAPQTVLERYGIGTANLNFTVADETIASTDANIEDFFKAATRLKAAQGLYVERPGGVVFLGGTLFRATIEMPANVPVGVYTATVYLFRDGAVTHAQTSPLYVGKAGFERQVFDFAHTSPLAYGIIAVLVALIAGWAASAIFRRS